MPDDAKLDRSTPKLGQRFEDALVYATQKHSGQTRKASGIPYVSHVLSVAALVLESGGDEDQAIAALLHDAVEDCGGAPILADIRQRFGDRVAFIVAGCTDTDQIPKPPWRARKDDYLRHLREAPEDVRLVSVADKLHNVRSIVADYRALGDAVWERFAGRKDGSLWYYRALLDVFLQGKPELQGKSNRLIEEFERSVLELERMVQAP